MILTDRQAACDLYHAGWPIPLIPLMVAIGHRESSLNTEAVNRDSSVASAPPTGWLQVRAFPERTSRWNLLDPVQNAQAAYSVYQDQGIGAWTTHSQAEQDLPVIQASLAGWSTDQCGPQMAARAVSSSEATGIPAAVRNLSSSFLAGGQVVAGLVAILVGGLLILQSMGAGGQLARGATSIARRNPLLRALT